MKSAPRHTQFRGRDNPNDTDAMTHKEMLLQYIIHPITDGFHNIFEHALVKALIIAGGFPTMIALDLFATPRDWWQGLLFLVILDWLGGVIASIRNGNFDARIAVRKWYHVTGYIVVCGGAAVISNTFEVFYLFQFVVYASFFLKEFVSILHTFRFIALFEVAWDVFVTRKLSLKQFRDFTDEVDRRADKYDSDHKQA